MKTQKNVKILIVKVISLLVTFISFATLCDAQKVYTYQDFGVTKDQLVDVYNNLNKRGITSGTSHGFQNCKCADRNITYLFQPQNGETITSEEIIESYAAMPELKKFAKALHDHKENVKFPSELGVYYFNEMYQIVVGTEVDPTAGDTRKIFEKYFEDFNTYPSTNDNGTINKPDESPVAINASCIQGLNFKYVLYLSKDPSDDKKFWVNMVVTPMLNGKTKDVISFEGLKLLPFILNRCAKVLTWGWLSYGKHKQGDLSEEMVAAINPEAAIDAKRTGIALPGGSGSGPPNIINLRDKWKELRDNEFYWKITDNNFGIQHSPGKIIQDPNRVDTAAEFFNLEYYAPLNYMLYGNLGANINKIAGPTFNPAAPAAGQFIFDNVYDLKNNSLAKGAPLKLTETTSTFNNISPQWDMFAPIKDPLYQISIGAGVPIAGDANFDESKKELKEPKYPLLRINNKYVFKDTDKSIEKDFRRHTIYNHVVNRSSNRIKFSSKKYAWNYLYLQDGQNPFLRGGDVNTRASEVIIGKLGNTALTITTKMGLKVLLSSVGLGEIADLAAEALNSSGDALDVESVKAFYLLSRKAALATQGYVNAFYVLDCSGNFYFNPILRDLNDQSVEKQDVLGALNWTGLQNETLNTKNIKIYSPFNYTGASNIIAAGNATFLAGELIYIEYIPIYFNNSLGLEDRLVMRNVFSFLTNEIAGKKSGDPQDNLKGEFKHILKSDIFGKKELWHLSTPKALKRIESLITSVDKGVDGVTRIGTLAGNVNDPVSKDFVTVTKVADLDLTFVSQDLGEVYSLVHAHDGQTDVVSMSGGEVEQVEVGELGTTGNIRLVNQSDADLTTELTFTYQSEQTENLYRLGPAAPRGEVVEFAPNPCNLPQTIFVGTGYYNLDGGPSSQSSPVVHISADGPIDGVLSINYEFFTGPWVNYFTYLDAENYIDMEEVFPDNINLQHEYKKYMKIWRQETDGSWEVLPGSWYDESSGSWYAYVTESAGNAVYGIFPYYEEIVVPSGFGYGFTNVSQNAISILPQNLERIPLADSALILVVNNAFPAPEFIQKESFTVGEVLADGAKVKYFGNKSDLNEVTIDNIDFDAGDNYICIYYFTNTPCGRWWTQATKMVTRNENEPLTVFTPADAVVKTGEGEAPSDDFNLKSYLFPNPAVNYTDVNLTPQLADLPGDWTIDVLDLAGRVMGQVKMKAGTETVRLNVSEFDAGVYIVKIQKAGKTYSHKMLIER